ncbi:MAG: hypothetical protein K2P84_03210 [Undibacterium sp.]|nr:hypothetical protein [Undibacterium sp.]
MFYVEDIEELLAASPNDKVRIGDQLFAVRIAYQLPVTIKNGDKGETEEALPSTFEDALAFENLEFFGKLEGNGLARKFRDAIANCKGVEAIGLEMFNALKGGSKAEFSLDIIWSKEFGDLKCPTYIGEGLKWLEDRLINKRKEVVALPTEVIGGPT